jgi:Cu(I)/Ag(I) efflux system periplasmic protein CusF
MKKTSLQFIFSLALLLLVSACATATQTSISQTPAANILASHGTAILPISTVNSASADMTEGDIRKIDKETQKITIKHGRIKTLDMSPMTMVFHVKDVALLDNFASGDKIIFSVENQRGTLVVTRLEKVVSK